MSKDQNKKGQNKPDSPDLTTRIRQGRKFNLSEAIGRAAGGSLKGASPVPANQQLLLQVDELLDSQLGDSEGSLVRTIVANLADNPPLLRAHRDDAAGAVRTYLEKVLATPVNLAELVRQTDARWGRDYDERPHFERPGHPPNPDDPYTLASVRTLLERLQSALNQ